MQFQEMIRIEAEPFPKDLPRPGKELVSLFQSLGFSFSDEGRTIVLRDIYDPDRLELVKRLITENELDVVARRSVWSTFDEQDYGNAPLWVLLFPGVWADEVDFSKVCGFCGIKNVIVDPSVRIERLDAKNKPIVTVNGQFTVVRDDLCRLIENELSGAIFSTFDYICNYYYFMASNHLSPLIIHPSEVISNNGICPKCSTPRFENYFGPLRFPATSWQGHDVARAEFRDANVYTPRAAKFFGRYEKKTRTAKPD
jgi:hypothetical protein